MRALLRGQVGCVDVIHGTLGDESRLEHGAHVGEDQILKALFANVVEKNGAQQVAGEKAQGCAA